MLTSLQPSGIEFILVLQSYATPFLNGFFYLITELGGAGLLFIVPLLVWCLEPRLGLRALLAITVSQLIVIALKESVQELRPFITDPRVLSPDTHSYSFPSGHAVRAMVFYGLIALWINKQWLRWLLAAIILSIGLSRIYLGAHYPHDVIAGFIVGIIFLWSWSKLSKPISHRFYHSHPLTQAIVAFIIPILVAIAYGWLFGHVTTAPLVVGALSATILCLTIDKDQRLVSKLCGPHDTWLRKTLRYSLGMIILALVMAIEHSLFKMAHPYNDWLLTNITLWLSGFVTIWVVGYGVPKLMALTPLCGTHHDDTAHRD